MIHEIRHLDCVLIKWHTLDGGGTFHDSCTDTSHVLALWQQIVVSSCFSINETVQHVIKGRSATDGLFRNLVTLFRSRYQC